MFLLLLLLLHVGVGVDIMCGGSGVVHKSLALLRLGFVGEGVGIICVGYDLIVYKYLFKSLSGPLGGINSLFINYV